MPILCWNTKAKKLMHKDYWMITPRLQFLALFTTGKIVQVPSLQQQVICCSPSKNRRFAVESITTNPLTVREKNLRCLLCSAAGLWCQSNILGSIKFDKSIHRSALWKLEKIPQTRFTWMPDHDNFIKNVIIMFKICQNQPQVISVLFPHNGRKRRGLELGLEF